ncbi:MAG: hypothetical protein E6J41_10120 [Chloroflexi bacterium]|nr:MAG: hypothetical protein E6J41_10120 [Chloroflexota bacterium]
MTLSTHVYVLGQADVHEVFHTCRRLLGCEPHHAFTDGPWMGQEDPDHWCLWNQSGQELPAWLRVQYRSSGVPLRTPEQTIAHNEGCEEADRQQACWLDVDFDAGYEYRDEQGGCGELHARLVAQLGRHLDSKGIAWSWKNEFSGEVHDGPDQYERLADLCHRDVANQEWFRNIVWPGGPGCSATAPAVGPDRVNELLAKRDGGRLTPPEAGELRDLLDRETDLGSEVGRQPDDRAAVVDHEAER